MVDIKNAFWHLKVEKNRAVCTLQMVTSRFWLECGTGSMNFSDLNGVYCIADDLICTGSGPDIATATRDHDANLIA
jgi:hypothetical protein